MNVTKNIFLLSVLAVLCTQASLTWGGPMPETATQSPSNISVEYQDAISKAYPGYQILSPSEIVLNKEALGTELYNKLKANPGVIVGKFNNDNIEDFVAVVRSSATKAYSWSPHGQFIDKNNIEKYDVYAVNLAVCYGLGSGKFNCKLIPGAYGETKPGTFGEVYLPTDFAHHKTGAVQYICTSVELSVKAGGMHQYRDDFGKDYSNNDDMGIPIIMHNKGSNFLTITKFQENLQYELISKFEYLKCTGLSEKSVLIPEATTKLPNAIPAEYQAAISKSFPGNQILRPSEILLNKKEMGTKLFNRVKASPSLIVGKFNNDNIEDFAALIRNTTKKSYVQTLEGEVIDESYEAHLAVCYGLGGGKFDCTKIPRAFAGAGLSTDWVLNKTGPSKYFCSSLKEVDLSSNQGDDDYSEKQNVKLAVKTDVINYFKSSTVWADAKYIYQSEDAFLKCIESSE
jgi:hypothetical protein